MGELILITGGARSGKSAAALELGEGFEGRVFLATAEAFDEEMLHRIDCHQAERGTDWETIEAPLDLAGAIHTVGDSHTAIVIDCLSVWVGNLIHYDPDIKIDAPPFREMLTALETSSAGRTIIVTNEVGMGIVPENVLARRYRDLAGKLNQVVASLADRVILMICGQAMIVKKTESGGFTE